MYRSEINLQGNATEKRPLLLQMRTFLSGIWLSPWCCYRWRFEMIFLSFTIFFSNRFLGPVFTLRFPFWILIGSWVHSADLICRGRSFMDISMRFLLSWIRALFITIGLPKSSFTKNSESECRHYRATNVFKSLVVDWGRCDPDRPASSISWRSSVTFLISCVLGFWNEPRILPRILPRTWFRKKSLIFVKT